MKWEYINAEEYCESVRDGTHDTPKPTEKGYKLVTGKHIKNGQIDPNDAYYISEKDYNKINERSLVEQWDVLMSMIGTVGEVAVVRDSPDYAIKNVALFKCGGSELKGKWLAYYLKSSEAQGHMTGNQKGSSQQFLSLKQLRSLPVPVTDEKNMQKTICFLSAYDDLIENNQKQIKLLEEAAQRLYKEWFVDLRFPGYENTTVVDGVPQGWRKVSLSELIEYEIGGDWGEDQPTEKCDLPAYVIRGTDLYDVTHGNAKSIPYRFHAKGNLDSRKLQDGDIVFEVSGGSKNEGVARTALITESLIDFLGGDVICASFCKLIRFKDKSSAKYMYDTFQYLRNSGETVKYDKRSASSIVNYRWKDFLEQQFIFIPTSDILTQYNTLAETMQKVIVNKAQIIEQAKQARDRLLPKLMSGELEV